MRAIKSTQKQQGALMIITLIVLLIVTYLATSTIDTTGLEMKMSSNSRDQQQAFEAAEYTLSWVESSIKASGGYTDESLTNVNCAATCFEPTCTNGYCFDGSSPLNWQNCLLSTPASDVYEASALWADDSGFYRTLTVPNMGITTKYIVEFRCYTARNSNIPMDVANNARIYRITAFATGTGSSRVMLRSKMSE